MGVGGGESEVLPGVGKSEWWFGVGWREGTESGLYKKGMVHGVRDWMGWWECKKICFGDIAINVRISI